MSVYDCEPPQLDCDIPPPDEEISKRRENDFDLDDLELSSYSMNLNEQSISNALHLYNSSPPPVDDFFTHKDDYLGNLEIPQDENTEISANDDELNPIDLPELLYTSPEKNKEDDESSRKEVDTPEMSSKVELDKSDEGEIPENLDDGPKIRAESLEIYQTADNFILEDFPEDEELNTTDVEFDCHIQELPKEELIVEENLQSDDDDDFDNFNDFEQAIPIDRHIEQQIESEEKKSEPSEVHFEADFSSFEANFDNEFQAFSSHEGQEKSSDMEEKQTSDDIDDDFGDFNDFTQAPSLETTSIEPPNEILQTTIAILNDSEVKTILTEMFPVDQEVNDENAPDSIKCREDDVKIVKDVDSTLALSYDYKDSTTNHILIKALGIDERNILFGAQWSSNMPRFASDLSFNPLEPSKFASASSFKNNSNTVVNNSSINTTKAKEKHDVESEKEHNQQLQQPDIVPRFDWNVSGLINPLDGKQAASLKAIEREEPPINYDLSVFDGLPQKNPEIMIPEIDNNSLSNKHLWQNERFDVTNTVVRERTIKLPETHIFTPIKSISPVAREVSRESSPIENEKDKRTTVIKEYHDIEYSLEPPKKVDSDGDFGDFNDFQSATSTVSNNPGILMPTTTISTLEPTILEPQKVNDFKSSTISSSAVINDLESLITSVPSQDSQSKYDVFTECSKPADSQIEDDFADFQAAPTIPPPLKQPSVEKPSYKEDSAITLSPSRLVSNLQNIPESHIHQQTLTTWMNDVLDSDEINRIEAAFPKCKIDSTKKKMQQIVDVNTASPKEDDEWCDFQSVSQSSNISSAHTVPNLSSFDAKKMNSDIDTSSDWSDFVSVPVVKPSINTSQFLSKPNFSSWNQSVGKPYVNHTTSFLSSNNNYPNNHFDESFYASMSDNKRNRQPMTITNNFNYSFERQDVSTTSVPPYQMSNGISTILPDLQFALPKTLVNLSRGNGSDTTKK